ncbi:uncharacterized protein Dmul_03750 [Desulfococcus multivorans]|nr:uncharacterized protein Dmul_03750 [Desulfococcus multivorans]
MRRCGAVQKKIPDRKQSIRDIPFLSTESRRCMHRLRAVMPSARLLPTYVDQAGLLTPGSPYRPRLPGLSASGILRLSSPITAAGPSPDSTGFPFQL